MISGVDSGLESRVAAAALPQRRRPPVALAAGLAFALAVAGALDWLAAGAITTDRARAGGAQVTANARTAGRMAVLMVDEGQAVKAGAVLARLDAEPLRGEVAEAEASLAVSRGRLSSALAEAAKEASLARRTEAETGATVTINRAGLAGARATLARARAEVSRLLPLQRRGLVSGQELDAALGATRLAEAGVAAAQGQVDGATATLGFARAAVRIASTRAGSVAIESADVARAASRLARARANLALADVIAPIDGVVAHRLIGPGEQVGAFEGVFTIIDPRHPWVTAYVDEMAAPRLRDGARASIRFDALPSRSFTGHVAFVGPATAEPAGASHEALLAGVRTPQHVAVRLTLESPDPAIRPGMSATVRIEAGWR